VVQWKKIPCINRLCNSWKCHFSKCTNTRAWNIQDSAALWESLLQLCNFSFSGWDTLRWLALHCTQERKHICRREFPRPSPYFSQSVSSTQPACKSPLEAPVAKKQVNRKGKSECVGNVHSRSSVPAPPTTNSQCSGPTVPEPLAV